MGLQGQIQQQFTNTIKHTTCRTNRIVDRHIRKLYATPIQSQYYRCKRPSNYFKSTTQQALIDRHQTPKTPRTSWTLLAHSDIYTLALNTNIMSHMWKLANIMTIPKPNKNNNFIQTHFNSLYMSQNHRDDYTSVLHKQHSPLHYTTRNGINGIYIV